MTTTTSIPTAPAEVLAALRTALGEMLDARDLPGNWTVRQRDAYEARRARMQALVAAWPAWQIERPTARRDAAVAALARLRAAREVIQQHLDAAPDWRTIPDARDRDREWERQQTYVASLEALDRGAHQVDGRLLLPAPLRAALTPPPCATCGRPHDVDWPGPIPDLEAEVARQEKLLAEAQWHLDSAVSAGRALLSETVATD